MKRSIWIKLLLFHVILTIMSVENTYTQNIWSKLYSINDCDNLRSGQITSDGGYIIAGWGGDCWDDFWSSWLIKLDVYGDTSWTKKYNSWDYQADIKIYSVQQTPDGGYIFTGSCDPEPYGEETSQIWLVKTDPSGDTSWTRTYAGEAGYSVQQTLDQGYIIAGVKSDDIVLIKTDSGGDTSWTKRYGGTGMDETFQLIRTGDQGYNIAGRTSSYGSGAMDVWLIKTNSSGDTLWTKTYGGTGDDMANSVQQTSDGGYIIAGETSSSGEGKKDLLLIKTDPAGNTVWSKTYGGVEDDMAKSVQQTVDGGYIVAGETESFGTGYIWDIGNIWLLKTNPAGDIHWSKTYSTAREYYEMKQYHHGARSVQQTCDKGYFIAGSKVSAGGSSWRFMIYLIKTDSLGNTKPLTAINNDDHSGLLTEYQLYQNFPNPFNPVTKISYIIPESDFVTLTVYDLRGRKIETLVSQFQKAGKYDVHFNAQHLSSGVYFFQLKAGTNFAQTKKMVYLK
jgi:hypothetical protein